MPGNFYKFGLLRNLHLKLRAVRVASSPLFDSNWYLRRYPDVRETGIHPVLHYVASGGAEGRWPHPLFDPACFRRRLDRAPAGDRTLLEHYLSLPPRERPSPHPLFDSAWYRANNPEVLAEVADALVHFIRIGGRRAYPPHRQFDSAWYLARYPDVERNGVNPLVHYLNSGASELRDPNPRFSTRSYLEKNPDVAAARINPLVHYVVSGMREARAANPESCIFDDDHSGAPAASRSQVQVWAARALKSFSACLRQRPFPLIDGRNRTVISWAAKSACTHVLIWHLDRLGLLAEANAHSAWPHNYRIRFYHNSSQYREALERLESEGPEGWTCIKIVRDPARRCISSYRHALHNGYEDQLMAHYLGRQIRHADGFSYADFLEYLEMIDLEHCNIHHRLQRHPLDAVPFGRKRLIHIDQQDLAAALEQIDRAQGIGTNTPGPERELAITQAARRHAPETGFEPADPELWKMPLTRTDGDAWPKSELQTCSEATEWARRIYDRDYAMFEWFSRQCEPLIQPARPTSREPSNP
ncbi:MAG: sulfotransferase family 2 domain-containing protein [Wenzhouxiangellaceae bacterium]